MGGISKPLGLTLTFRVGCALPKWWVGERWVCPNHLGVGPIPMVGIQAPHHAH